MKFSLYTRMFSLTTIATIVAKFFNPAIGIILAITAGSSLIFEAINGKKIEIYLFITIWIIIIMAMITAKKFDPTIGIIVAIVANSWVVAETIINNKGKI